MSSNKSGKVKGAVHGKKKGKKKAKTNGQPKTPKAPAIIVTIDGEQKALQLKRFRSPKFTAKLLAEIEAAVHPVKFSLDDILDVNDHDRWEVLRFAAQINGARFKVGKTTYDQLLDAMIARMVGSDDISRCTKAKLAALEAAVLCHPEGLDVACGEIAKRCHALKIPGIKTQGLLQQAKQIQKQVSQNQNESPPVDSGKPVRSILSDAPVSDEAVVPPGWRLSADGIERQQSEDPDRRIAAPILIAARGIDLQKGTELLTVSWRRDEVWKQRDMERRDIADARAIIRLAEYGVPVTSNNARVLVQFLGEYEARNLSLLPTRQISSRMGWLGANGKLGFLWGNALITKQGIEAGDGTETEVVFRGADSGNEQLAKGFTPAGSFEGWLSAIEPVAGFQRVVLTLYTSFVPALLFVLRALNFVLDLAGPTSVGKTTALRVAASAWGNPSEGENGGVLYTWNSTATWRERAMCAQNHLPIGLDDTKLARNPAEVASTIYAVAQGRGRGRGTIQGLAEQEACSTVMLTSGEQPAINFTQDGGTRARVMTLWGSPFGETSQENGQVARAVSTKIRQHYGHAGPRFVEYVIRHRKQWKHWRKEFRNLTHHYEELAGDNAVAGRMASHLAAIVITSRLVHEALGLPWEWVDLVQPLWAELTSESREADRAAVALRHVISWANSNRQRFWPQAGLNAPSQGWIGRWNDEPAALGKKKKPWRCIGFLQHHLDAELRNAGFEPGAIVRQWKDRGWLAGDLEANGTVRSTKKMQIGKELVRMLVVKRTAIDEVQN